MNISQRIDALPMTPTTRKVIFFIGIGWFFDAMDQGMVSGVIASIGQDWALSVTQLSLLGSAGILGMILGAALSGIASDAWGRRTVIISTLLIFSIGSALCGLALSYEMLLVARFLTGFGLGGELPAASTLVSEISPLKKRGRNVVFLESFWAWGWIAAALVAYLLIPVYGWRAAFFVGALPALFAAILRFSVPESPRYLALRGRHEEADRLVTSMEKEAGIVYSPDEKTREQTTVTSVSFVANLARIWSKKHIRATAVLWVLWFGINFGYYGFVLWTPTLLMGQGFDMVKSFEFTLIMCIAQLPGYFCAAYLIERIGRKAVLTLFLVGTAGAAWFFGHAAGVEQILIYGSLLYFFALGSWGCVYSYTPEVYPTDVRGAGTGWAAAFGRIGALIAPMIVPVLFSFAGAEYGFTLVFIVLTVVFIVVALVVGIFGKETKGVPLDG